MFTLFRYEVDSRIWCGKMTRVYGLFRVYAASWDRFLVSYIWNCLAVEVVIMHEKKGFSHTIRDKI